jgi:futalosine hydrolase
MRVLVVTATLLEVRPFLSRLLKGAVEDTKRLPAGTLVPLPEGRCPKGGLLSGDCLITGVGAPFSATHLTRQYERGGGYDLSLQVGLCGSFVPTQLPKKSLVRVTSDSFSDIGAEDNGSFLDLVEMGLLEKDEFPFTHGMLIPNVCELAPPFDTLPKVRSVTVNRVLSESVSIEWVRERYRPDVVNMEGAAFFYTSMLYGIPCASIRAVSDTVGPRDKGSWEIAGAVDVLCEALTSWWILPHF